MLNTETACHSVYISKEISSFWNVNVDYFFILKKDGVIFRNKNIFDSVSLSQNLPHYGFLCSLDGVYLFVPTALSFPLNSYYPNNMRRMTGSKCASPALKFSRLLSLNDIWKKESTPMVANGQI